MINRIVVGISFLILVVVGGHFLWTNYIQTNKGEDIHSPSIVIVPFVLSGSAGSGQYTLELDSFTDAVSNHLGAVSNWTVLESSRKDMLLQEIEAAYPQTTTYQAELSVNESELQTTETIAIESVTAHFPSANYIVLGRINGFDVIAERSSGVTPLSKRVNRIISTIDVRIVDVNTRQWLASQTVTINETLPDNTSAETQIQKAIQIGARKVVNALLLAEAKQFAITEARSDSTGNWVSISGGSRQGIEQGMQFRAHNADPTRTATLIEIVEVRPMSSLARVMKGVPSVGDAVPAQPSVQFSETTNQALRIAIGGFYQPGSEKKQLVSSVVLDQLAVQLRSNFTEFEGVNVVEDQAVLESKMLAKQMLDDLHKGREPGLPRGSLRGVDYLVFTSIEYLGLEASETKSYQAFGTTISEKTDAKGKFYATAYLVDVNSGEMAISRKIALDQTLPESNDSRLYSQFTQSLGRHIAGELMLSIRPLAVIEKSGDSVVLNHKSLSGLKVGDIFTASGKGRVVFDESTQSHLHNVGGEVIAELEITHFDGGGWAHAKIIDGDVPPIGSLLTKSNVEQTKESSVQKPKLNW